MRSRLTPKRTAKIVLLALAALAIGAVFGQANSGQASAKDKPTNTAPPAISGTPTEGQTLTTTDGTWTGTTPITFTYQWGRCDGTGGSCAAISGATAKTYKLTHADAGNTLRATVTAKNADGTTSATSVPTAVIAGTPPTVVDGCPVTGTGTLQIADIAPPARLLLNQGSITPKPVTKASKEIKITFNVTACKGRPIQGALVYVTAVPFNQYTVPAEATTDASGNATVTMNQLSGFPAARQQQLLTVFGRARKSGEDLLGGVSTRRLVSFPVSLK